VHKGKKENSEFYIRHMEREKGRGERERERESSWMTTKMKEM